MDEQERVARFVAENDLECPPAFRLLDLVAEVGELAEAAAESTDDDDDPGTFDLPEDESGTRSSPCSPWPRDSASTRATRWTSRWRSTRRGWR